MSISELIATACKGAPDEGELITTNNGFDLYLGMAGDDYSFSLKCHESGEFFAHSRCGEADTFAEELVGALYRAFNSGEDFDEDDDFSIAFVEATEDEDGEWGADDIQSWLQAELG